MTTRRDTSDTQSPSSSSGTSILGGQKGAQVQRSQGTGRTGLAHRHRFFMGMPTPFDLIQNLSDEMDMLARSLGVAANGGTFTTRTGDIVGPQWIPTIEVVREPDAFLVRAELPGINASDIDVSVNENVLTISGERTQEERERHDGMVRTERVYGSFLRTIPLPQGARDDQVEASFDNGVLEVKVPISAQRQGRQVQVQPGTGSQSQVSARSQSQQSQSQSRQQSQY